MKLLVDIGNTRLKAALWDGHVLRPLGAATHAGALDAVDIATFWERAGDVDGVLVASVAGAAVEQRLAAGVARRFGLRAEFLASSQELCGVRNAYAEPARLGIDRLLGLVALHASQAGACVLAGCGTALTLDAVDADGAHLGGLICASPPLMIDALTSATARLDAPRSAHIVDFADNTADAIESGAWQAAAALVGLFVERTTAHLAETPALILTGGGADRLSGLIGRAHRVEPDLVLRGLATCARSVA